MKSSSGKTTTTTTTSRDTTRTIKRALKSTGKEEPRPCPGSLDISERSKLEQEGGGGTPGEVYVGVGIGVPLLVISLVLLVRNLMLADKIKNMRQAAVEPPKSGEAAQAV